MREFPIALSTLVTLVFVDILMLFSYLRKPYFVLFGVLFVEGSRAAILSLCLVGLALLTLYMAMRRRRSASALAWALAVVLIANSVSNVVAAVIVHEDLAGFLNRITGMAVLGGFIVLQVFFVVVNILLLLALRGARTHLRS